MMTLRDALSARKRRIEVPDQDLEDFWGIDDKQPSAAVELVALALMGAALVLAVGIYTHVI